jgi:hypothetical protein
LLLLQMSLQRMAGDDSTEQRLPKASLAHTCRGCEAAFGIAQTDQLCLQPQMLTAIP